MNPLYKIRALGSDRKTNLCRREKDGKVDYTLGNDHCGEILYFKTPREAYLFMAMGSYSRTEFYFNPDEVVVERVKYSVENPLIFDVHDFKFKKADEDTFGLLQYKHRVRLAIDDVEHYLQNYKNYMEQLKGIENIILHVCKERPTVFKQMWDFCYAYEYRKTDILEKVFPKLKEKIDSIVLGNEKEEDK